jgi:hypothetical protein
MPITRDLACKACGYEVRRPHLDLLFAVLAGWGWEAFTSLASKPLLLVLLLPVALPLLAFVAVAYAVSALGSLVTFAAYLWRKCPACGRRTWAWPRITINP